MNIRLLVVGRTSVNWVREGMDMYASRLGHYASFTVTELPELKKASALSENEIKEKEADMLLKALKPQDYVVLLDEHGSMYRSLEFASWLDRKLASGGKNLVFIIGGAYGFSPRIYAIAQEKISLSPMTFSHQMVRTVFTEQLYRAFTILKGEPYHHE